MHKQHPLAELARKHSAQSLPKLSLRDYCDAKHLLVSFSGDSRNSVDELLAEHGVKRRVAVTVNQFSVAAYVLLKSDLIMTLPNCFHTEMGIS